MTGGAIAPELIAALDLGSNSFHLITAEFEAGKLTIVDRLRESVRLSEGLDSRGAFSAAAMQRALDCLQQFGDKLKRIGAMIVRAAGTSALRRVRDNGTFLAKAEQALGHSIDVITGTEEARLIYSGVVGGMPESDASRLVLDIGGGSTEVILGRDRNPVSLESINVGSVILTETHFVNGGISLTAFRSARADARARLRTLNALEIGTADVDTIGTSGTIRATAAVARELGFLTTDDLTLSCVEALIGHVLKFRNTAELSLTGLTERRSQVWPGGLAILVELMSILQIDRLRISDGALREGLLYEYVNRQTTTIGFAGARD